MMAGFVMAAPRSQSCVAEYQRGPDLGQCARIPGTQLFGPIAIRIATNAAARLAENRTKRRT